MGKQPRRHQQSHRHPRRTTRAGTTPAATGFHRHHQQTKQPRHRKHPARAAARRQKEQQSNRQQNRRPRQPRQPTAHPTPARQRTPQLHEQRRQPVIRRATLRRKRHD